MLIQNILKLRIFIQIRWCFIVSNYTEVLKRCANIGQA